MKRSRSSGCSGRAGISSYRGEYLDLEDARVFDLPDELPVIAVAAGGPDAAELAAELGDGMFGTEPKAELFDAYHGAGGDGPTYGEVGLAWAETEDAAVQAAFESSRWSLTGWKVMSELPNPANFEAASQVVRPEDVAAAMPCGPDAAKHLDAIREYERVGYDHVVLMNSGPDPDGFMDFFARELKPAARRVTRKIRAHSSRSSRPFRAPSERTRHPTQNFRGSSVCGIRSPV